MVKQKYRCNRAGKHKPCEECNHADPHERVEYDGMFCTTWIFCFAHLGPSIKVRCVKVKEPDDEGRA